MPTSRDWSIHFREAFRDLRDLYGFLGWEFPEGHLRVERSYPLFIPRALARKLKDQGPDGVLAREFLPDERELHPAGLLDPIGDRAYQRAPQLIHRYPSRALFTATSVCPVNCRYCFRKNELAVTNELFQQDFEETLSYLRAHPEVSEIIFTGGDPLTLSNEKLEKYLMAFGELPSIRDLRFHTRYPVILPERIDAGFLSVLGKASAHFRTVSVAIHANHVSEFDEENSAAIGALAATGIQLLSQTVLLRGVNDSCEALLGLVNKFLELKIRPYYLHHPDQVKGGMHFYLSLEEGRSLYQKLRGLLPGWAIPLYVIDVPGGHGKVSAFNPETHAYSGNLMALNGTIISAAEPNRTP